MRSWRACPFSDSGNHRWIPFARDHIMARRYELNFKRKVLAIVEFRVQCEHCFFCTRARINFRDKTVEVKA